MPSDHSKLICDIGELTALFTDARDIDAFLQRTVDMVAAHMGAEVCSVYLFYEDEGVLVLKATRGLDPASVGQVRLRLGEGLTGKAVEEYRPVCEGDARAHPSFRHFANIGEEPYCSFLAVPVARGMTRIGALTLQSIRKNAFTPEHVTVFRAIASQLANTVEIAKLLMSVRSNAPVPVAAAPSAVSVPRLVRGRSGAEGFAFGEALVVMPPALNDIRTPEGPPLTLEDLRKAVDVTEEQLARAQRDIEERLFDVASLIFSAQILMLKDQSVLGAMEQLVAAGRPADEAVRAVVGEYASRFDRMANPFLREKKYDVLDVGRRLLENLVGNASAEDRIAGHVAVARELLPSDALKLGSRGVGGMVLLTGGVTSHVAVLARSLGIPLIIADEPGLLALPPGARLLLDGGQGNIYVDPAPEIVAPFLERETSRADAARVRGRVRSETETRDGVRVRLMANINLLGDAAVAREYRAEGVGLYRTEFPFIVRSDFPSEEEQYVIYRRLAAAMKGLPLTFRTLDIGGDKVLSYYDNVKEANPFLGLRSIRFSLRHREIFVQQVRAILRAGAESPVRMMFPMVSSLDEFRSARAVVDACLADLARTGIPHQAAVDTGVMIELPAAVAMADELAREAAFFSIGTNDLIQYTLAVDRTNEKVADLYVPHHPAVLRLLKTAVDAAVCHGRDVSVCGDMAHDPRYAPFLVGIGVRTLSLDARYLPKIQETLLELDSRQAARDAARLLACVTAAEAEALLPSAG